MSFGLAELLSKGWVAAQGFSVHDAGAGFSIARADVTPADITDGSEVDTGVDLPDPCVVTEVFLDVETPESTATTKTVDVGLLSGETAGDADGFLDAADVSSAGIVLPSLASASQTRGALLREDEDGAGALVPAPHAVDGNAVSISITGGDAAGFTEFTGSIYVVHVALDA